MIMKRLILISICFISCSTRNDYSIERYHVYEAILDKEIPWTQFNRVLVCNETIKDLPKNDLVTKLDDGEIVQSNDLRLLKNYWHDFRPDEFYTDYTYRNNRAYSIDSNVFHLHNRIEVVSRKNFKYSEYFSKDHYDNAILYCYSMPSFNSNYTEAVVYSEYYCGNSRGAGAWFWLKKINDDWDIKGRRQVWSF
jgi:hypothetical protein